MKKHLPTDEKVLKYFNMYRRIDNGTMQYYSEFSYGIHGKTVSTKLTDKYKTAIYHNTVLLCMCGLEHKLRRLSPNKQYPVKITAEIFNDVIDTTREPEPEEVVIKSNNRSTKSSSGYYGVATIKSPSGKLSYRMQFKWAGKTHYGKYHDDPESAALDTDDMIIQLGMPRSKLNFKRNVPLSDLIHTAKELYDESIGLK